MPRITHIRTVADLSDDLAPGEIERLRTTPDGILGMRRYVPAPSPPQTTWWWRHSSYPMLRILYPRHRNHYYRHDLGYEQGYEAP